MAIRPGEGRTAWLFFAYFFLLATSHYAVKSVRQATYIDSLGADRLPFVYLLLAVVSLPVIILYSRLAERFQLHRLIIGLCLGHGLVLAAFFWLFALASAWVPMAFYVWVTVAFGVAVSQLWSYANHVFDPRQARRLFAFVGAGGLLGGIPGGLIARVVSSQVGTRHTLFAAAALMLGVAALVMLIERVRPAAGGTLHTEEMAGRLGAARGGLRTVLGSRLLLIVATLMLVTMVTAQMVDLQFNWAVQQVTSGLDQRTGVFGSFFSVMGLLAFVFQLLFTQRIHRALGVGFGMRVLPVTVAVTTVLLILSMGFFPAALLAVAWLLKLGEGGLRHSLDQATRELLFLPVAAPARRRGKAFIDVFVQRFAKGAAALLLLPVTFGLLEMRHVSLITLAMVGLWLWITAVARREYVGAFRDGLRPGRLDGATTIDIGDVTTLTTLVQSLGSADAREVLHAMDLLAAHGQSRLVPPLLLRHDDPAVRRRTLEVLAAEGRSDASSLIERAIADDDPDVRSAAIRTLAALGREDVTTLMDSRLSDPDPRMRAAAVAFLLDLGDEELRQRASAVLAEMLSDGDPRVRAEAVRALGQVAEPTGRESLIQVLYDRDLGVVREAIVAVRRRLAGGERSPLYTPILISLTANRRLKHDAREAIVASGEEAIESLVLFMNSADEQIWVRRAVPKTIALLGGAGAAEALVDSLTVSDTFLRGKVIEALAYLRSSQEELEFRAGPARRQIRVEAEHYLRSLADLLAVSSMHQVRLDGPHARWQSGARVPTLLQQMLAQRMASSVHNVFGLLELQVSPADVRAAKRSLLSGQAALRARALEYLDNTLGGSLRRDVFAIIDDAPAEDKVARGEQHYGISVETPEDTLRRLMSSDVVHDPDRLGLVVAASHSVYADGVAVLHPVVRSLAETSPEPLVRETAAWVADKISAGGSAAPPRVVGEENEMAAMAHIEMMVFLQNVDLFSYCNAEQVLRLAAIAREWRIPAGEVIFRHNEPADALFCVVEGAVKVETADGERRQVGAGGRFGVMEILSGRLRPGNATALTAARVLVIDAEDFFDLLSNNIEIVKALFRQLTGATGDDL